MATFKSQVDIDAYQIAENTPRLRHAFSCQALGVGALVRRDGFYRLCDCHILAAAYRASERINKED